MRRTYIVIDHPVASHKRDEERDSFGVTDGLNINIWYKLPILIESAYDDADFRMHIVSF